MLGWLIVALASVRESSGSWVFKGGTCVKKCYFETYRFSEDLDFSLLPDAAYTAEEIGDTLREACAIAAELSGIEFPPELVEVRARKNLQGEDTFLGLISYRGPLRMPIASLPRVRFDITQHEPVIDVPSPRIPLHAYPDSLPEATSIAAYSMEELLAEKTRALYERTRPRDLYDVVFLLENHSAEFDLGVARGFFTRKCASKGLTVPSTQDLIRVIEAEVELRSEWENMLGHQLPELPDLDSFLTRLPGNLDWIDEPSAVPSSARLPTLPVAATQGARAAPSGLRYWGRGLPLEVLRFAGSNRLLVEFNYHGKTRLVEPYSLRQADTGNLLLYGWERGTTHIKAFNVAKIGSLRATKQGFRPRYRIEL